MASKKNEVTEVQAIELKDNTSVNNSQIIPFRNDNSDLIPVSDLTQNQMFNIEDKFESNYDFDEKELDISESPDNYRFIEQSEQKPLKIQGIFVGIETKVNNKGQLYNLAYFFNKNENPKFSMCFASKNIIEFIKTNRIKKGTPLRIEFLRRKAIKSEQGIRYINEYKFTTSSKFILGVK